MPEPLIVTDIGRQRILEAIAADKKLLVTKIVFSSTFAAITPARTALTQPEEEFEVVAVSVKAKERLYIEALPIPSRRYPVHEAGIFLEDGTLLSIVGGPEPILFAITDQKLPISFETTIKGMADGVIQIVDSEARLNLSVAEEFAQIIKLFTDYQVVAESTERELRQMIEALVARVKILEAKVGGE